MAYIFDKNFCLMCKYTESYDESINNARNDTTVLKI